MRRSWTVREVVLVTIVFLVLGRRTSGQPGEAKQNSQGVWNAVWLPCHSSRQHHQI